ncbi:MAG: sensor histidine kinase [Terriglobales bacterium]|jgi:signal transduction histidine kinase
MWTLFRKFGWLVGLALISGLVSEVRGADAGPAVHETDFHHTAWNGFGAVFDIKQSSEGYLWLTTSKGVLRFDGVQFQPVEEVTRGAIHDSEIDSVFLSSSRGLRLNTRSAGLLFWKDGRLTDGTITSVPGTRQTISVRRDPAWFQTTWFLLLCVACGIFLVSAFYRLRVRQVAAGINARFDERLAERTRIAQELHDTLLQGFLSASMQVHVAADCLPEDSKAKPILTRALRLIDQVIDEGRNAIGGLRSSRSVSLDLEQAFARIPQELGPQSTNGTEVGFRVLAEGQQRPLHPLLRDEVYRIGREALINAFRHARANQIEVTLTYTSNQLRLLVRDNGCGIDPAILQAGKEGHWGLSGMRERADRIRARFCVMSSPSAGTEIELSVPGNVAFPGEPSAKLSWFKRRHGAKSK